LLGPRIHSILKAMLDKNSILVVEDDNNLLETLRYNLEKEGYKVFTAADGAAGVDTARLEKPDLVILDVMLPSMSGYEVCRVIRKEMNVPIMMLTARAEETDKIVGLEIGADDYVTKPFSVRELLARVKAMLRRSQMVQAEPASEGIVVQAGDIRIDTARHHAEKGHKKLDLTPKEFDLLAFLAKNKGFVFTRDQLLEKVWGYDFAGDTRTVDVHIRWLREKVEADPNEPKLLQTVRGIGYKLEG
jgi:DNA-binding response OmpR family regulator